MESTDDEPIDFDRLREISDGDTDMMNTLVEMYVEQIREILSELKSGVAEKDFDKVRRAAHKAVGSSATCGMNAIVAPLRRLEQFGARRDFEFAGEALSQTETAFAKTCRILEDKKSEGFR